MVQPTPELPSMSCGLCEVVVPQVYAVPEHQALREG
jgi:hypothetical protein